MKWKQNKMLTNQRISFWNMLKIKSKSFKRGIQKMVQLKVLNIITDILSITYTLPKTTMHAYKITIADKKKWASYQNIRLRNKMLVTQSCPTLCDPMDYSPPGFSVHGIFWARILEWVAISFSRESSRPRDQTHVSALQADSLLSEPLD